VSVNSLLDAALPLCRERSDRRPLLIVPRSSLAGKRLALRRGGVLGLEVDVENDRALTLYTSLGFTPIITEDYFALQLG
jgi:GNAT superfamily N-acetyltransferase